MGDSERKKPNPQISVRKARRTQRSGGRPPAVAHGTRVRFHVDCVRCGKSDTLTFVPKTKSGMLCKACAEEVFGPQWAGEHQTEGVKEYLFECAECGREGRVNFEPDGEGDLYCDACFRGEEQPMKERLKGKTVVTASKRRK